ncbi:MAG: hypothetical protein ABSF24_09115 [Candidatus Bathyarchaeia archaeon]|jgi:hypothetical protein
MAGQHEKIDLKKLRVEQPWLIEEEAKRILSRPKNEQIEIVDQIVKSFKLKSEETRWVIGLLIEYLLDYDPCLVPHQIILDMAADRSFSVRSSAAVCLFKLSGVAPSEVPLDVLSRLASVDEDWYVYSPALAALKVLSHKRPAAVGILVDMISSEDINKIEMGLLSLLDVVRNDPDAVKPETIQELEKHIGELKEVTPESVKKSLEEIISLIQAKPSKSTVIRYSPF